MSEPSKQLSFSRVSVSRGRKKIGLPENTQTKGILHRDSDTEEYRIIIDGIDYTPLPLDPEIYEPTVNVSSDVISPLSTSQISIEQKTFRTQSTAAFRNQIHTQNIEGDAVFHQRSIYIKSQDDIDVLVGSEPMEMIQTRSTESTKSSLQTEMHKIPVQISLTLNETDTFFILDIPSSTGYKDTDEGVAIEEDNKLYEYLTVGKGRNRRVFDAEAQTTKVLLKGRNTQADREKCKSNSTYASNWEMYDTLHPKEFSTESTMEAVMAEDNVDDDDEEEENEEHKLEEIESANKETVSSEEIQLMKIVKMPRFQDALCVIERLLANNCYNEQQKRFRGLADPNPLRENIEYNYTLKLLWTFQNDKTDGRCVTCLHQNRVNHDIVAVGYGKFYFMENATGMVMLWNIKNPRQPERHYNFADPVTAVCFSKLRPNLLAVGFYTGKVMVIDVSSRKVDVVAKSDPQTSPSFEAAWQAVWDLDEEDAQQEHLLVCFEDGRVCRYTILKGGILKCSQIMRVARAEGKLKGTSITGACDPAVIPISRYASALFINKHPVDPCMYYVGTNEGVIHTCSTNYYNQHLDLFSAHNGPVYGMKFNPFCNRVFVTGGEDWYLRLWVEGIADPIGEMMKNMEAVQDVDWSPTHSTILVAVHGKEINIWDIQRKIYNPQSVHLSPTNSRNTICRFTRNGRCLYVGDIDGNVHVYSLEDMPFPAFFQDDLLIQALKRALVAEPGMLNKLRKFGRLSFTKH